MYPTSVKKDIEVHYVFRLGELHVVFATLKAVARYIDASGSDSAFTKEEILGPATVKQVKAGKHMKRSVGAYLTLYLGLFRRLIEKLLQCNPAIEKFIRNGIADGVSNLEHYRNREKSFIQEKVFYTGVTTSFIEFN